MKARWIEFRKRHWDGRSMRERQVLAFSALLLLPVVAYWLLWQPAYSASTKLRATVPLLRAQAEQMRAQVAEAEALRHRPRPAVLDDGALKQAIEASATRHQLREALSSLDAAGPHSVRMTLVSVPFEQWLGWLRDLERENHIRAESVSVTALPQPGLVAVNATLTNGAGQ